jgi:exopolyphosphatase/guanosine-5'-triphosphate,3'-diphosphate pyrophosphatase
MPRKAVIDIGTNSVKLLIADVDDSGVCPILEKSLQTRLGHGLYDSGRLHTDSIKATVEAINEFFTTTGRFDLAGIGIMATSAMREAENAGELLDKIHKETGVQVKVISGDEEADLVFQGVSQDIRYSGKPLMILDIGGGSTEFILGVGKGEISFKKSYPMGTVRLLELLNPSDPPLEDLARCRDWVDSYYHESILPDILKVKNEESSTHRKLIGVGGTFSYLTRIILKTDGFDRSAIENRVVSKSEFQELLTNFWSIPLDQRRHTIGLPGNRADVILMGLLILEAALNELDLNEFHASTRGLRHGALGAAQE